MAAGDGAAVGGGLMAGAQVRARAVDPRTVRPYGDTLDDGMVQVSFTLPVPAGPEAEEAARRVAGLMRLEDPKVVQMTDLRVGYTFFVVYGALRQAIDFTGVKVAKVDAEFMGFDEVNKFIAEKIGRRIVVVGACIESDAHTVGIDAILNMKGFAGDYGLERYPWFRATNLGAQVPAEDLLARAKAENADAILVSQVVTQKNIHIANLTRLIDMMEAEEVRGRFLAVVGGPRLSHEFAVELGYDAGFGAGTVPSQVASFIAQRVYERQMKNGRR